MINHAGPRESDSPLSPIWMQRQFSSTEGDSSPDYITSNLGRQTPGPRLREPESPASVHHGDSGQGESDSDKHGEESDDSCDNRVIDPDLDLVIKWKKGKLLGRGAFGRVWEGLMDSTRMIAIKEVELDTESQEKAEIVGYHGNCVFVRTYIGR